MSSTNARNIVELRQLLATKFPGVKMSADPRETIANRWPTGLVQIDSLLQGGLPKGALTEIISPGIASGTALFLHTLIERARQNGEWIALIDASDSFDPTPFNNEILSRLLWVRCTQAKDAIKSADMLLHDGTLSLVVLDLLFTPSAQLRKIASSTWFRIQRILENTATAFVVLSPEHMISNAAARLTLEKRFSLGSLDLRRETLLAQITPSNAQPAAQRIVKIA
ncbi:MAG: hypothetical protein ACXW3Z_11235 [Limisphaerales bacterium]